MEGIGKSISKNEPKKTAIDSFNKANSKVITIVCVFLVLIIILVGITFSYAFWTTTVTQTEQNDIESGCLSFTLNDKDVDGNVTNINLPNTYPILDEKGMALSPYVFTITNTCTIDANVFVYLHNLGTSTMDSQYIKFNLNDTSSAINIGPSILSEINTESSVLDDVNNAVEAKVGSIKETFLLSNFAIKQSESITLNMRLWIDYDAPNSIMGSSYNSAVSVFATTPQE